MRPRPRPLHPSRWAGRGLGHAVKLCRLRRGGPGCRDVPLLGRRRAPNRAWAIARGLTRRSLRLRRADDSGLWRAVYVTRAKLARHRMARWQPRAASRSRQAGSAPSSACHAALRYVLGMPALGTWPCTGSSGMLSCNTRRAARSFWRSMPVSNPMLSSMKTRSSVTILPDAPGA